MKLNASSGGAGPETWTGGSAGEFVAMSLPASDGLQHGEMMIDRERTETCLFLPALKITRAKHYAHVQFVSPVGFHPRWSCTHCSTLMSGFLR